MVTESSGREGCPCTSAAPAPRPTKTDVQATQQVPGFVVLLGSSAGVCLVVADGVEFATDPAGEFWGFRDVPPGEHTMSVGTARRGQLSSLRVLVEPAGVVVLRIERAALVEETQRAVINAIARGVLTGSLKIDFVRFPAACRAESHRPRGPASAPASPEPEAAAARQMTLADIRKLEGLFRDVVGDPTSSALRQCYLDVVKCNLLLGTDDAALMRGTRDSFRSLPQRS
eukprot:m51a1_g10428 hypothetical protein (229) ;mRNA; f:30930-31616